MIVLKSTKPYTQANPGHRAMAIESPYVSCETVGALSYVAIIQKNFVTNRPMGQSSVLSAGSCICVCGLILGQSVFTALVIVIVCTVAAVVA